VRAFTNRRFLIGGCEHASKLTQRFLMAFVRDLGEIPGKLKAHSLTRADRTLVVLFEPVEEIAHRHAQDVRDLKQTTGRNSVDPALVFVGLLIRDADQVGKLLLRQAEHDPPFADPGAHIPIDILGSARRST
jgi:hypothetical protein